MGALGLRGLALIVGFALGIAGTAAGKPGPGHHAPSKDNGPWNCIRDDSHFEAVYAFDAGTQYIWFQSPDGQAVRPYDEGGWRQVQMWADGTWCLFDLEVVDKSGAAYAGGRPQESFANAVVDPNINFAGDGNWAGWASHFPPNPGTWPQGAHFTDMNAACIHDSVDADPLGAPFGRLTYYAAASGAGITPGGPVPDDETLGKFDQVWSDVVNGTVKKLAGPVNAHHLTVLYKKAVRNIGGAVYPAQ